ncbi:hypothetical protein [Alcanivorax sediminis]|uniref:Uncharacterized protein n=1 Tax=Alcanivorax sediminis TaxID=2663008 RepID=A0A6N7LPM6_9GAMM|nr:hypothetical protein [Alcanivorax sediminis]MQX52159.1 hypothetical protein [Alcanivorax sediminis]
MTKTFRFRQVVFDFRNSLLATRPCLRGAANIPFVTVDLADGKVGIPLALFLIGEWKK